MDPDQYNAVAELAGLISELGQDWSRRVPCRDSGGTLLTAGYAVDGIQAGDQLYTFDLHERVLDKSRPVIRGRGVRPPMTHGCGARPGAAAPARPCSSPTDQRRSARPHPGLPPTDGPWTSPPPITA